MTHDPTPVDLSGFADAEIDAIETEALRRGISFDDCCKQLLLEHSRQLQKKARVCPLRRFFGSSRDH